MQLVIFNKIFTEYNVWKNHKLIWSSITYNINLLVDQIKIYHSNYEKIVSLTNTDLFYFKIALYGDTNLLRQILEDILQILTKDVIHYLWKYRSVKFVRSS